MTRILWLKGREAATRNAYSRYIYIHGTPEESRIGRPASYGCIRMKSRDVARLYNSVPVGSKVKVVRESLPASPLSNQVKRVASAVSGAVYNVATLGSGGTDKS